MDLKKLSFLLIALFAVIFLNENLNNIGSRSNQKIINRLEGNLSSFIWSSPSSLTHEEIKEYISFAKQEGITILYVSIDEYVDVHELEEEKRNQLKGRFESNFKYFINEAEKNKISVIALAGHQEWGRSSHWYIPELLIDYVNEFNKNSEDSNIDGILFDIEFYNLNTFESKKQVYSIEYLTLVDQIIENNKQERGLQIGFAVPFWFDNSEVIPQVTYNESRKNLGYHLFDILNKRPDTFVFIMDYRDFAEGENGSINLVKGEFDYLTKNNLDVDVVVGQETAEVEEENVSFYRKGKSEFFTEIMKLDKEYKNNPNYKGIGIHDLQSFMEMEE